MHLRGSLKATSCHRERWLCKVYSAKFKCLRTGKLQLIFISFGDSYVFFAVCLLFVDKDK